MKKILFGNLGTKAMALFLAVLTWGYLYSQDQEPGLVSVEFLPSLDARELASVRYFDAQQHELAPGGYLDVQVIGPKGDVRSLRQRFYRCQVKIDQATLKDHGSLTVKLERGDFDFPDKFQVKPLPSIRIDFARYVPREIELVAGPALREGTPASGYEVQSIVAEPAKIRARVPANRADVDRVPIRRVPVGGADRTFVRKEWGIDASDLEARGIKVLAMQPFDVRVEIVPTTRSRTLRVPLQISVPPALKHRVDLVDKDVAVEVRGAEEDVKNFTEAALWVAVIVTEADIPAEGGPKNVRLVDYSIIDPRFRGKIAVEIMPDVAPANREFKLNTKPK